MKLSSVRAISLLRRRCSNVFKTSCAFAPKYLLFTLLGLSAYKLSKDIGIPQTRLSEIVKGNRRVTADTALRLSRYFGTSPKFWLDLQNDFDLEEEELAKGKELNLIRQFQRKAV